MATRPFYRSPGFWGVLGVLAAGAGVYAYSQRRSLGANAFLARSRSAGPAPTVVRNTARKPPVAETVRVGDMTLTRYTAAAMPIDQRVKVIQGQVWKGAHDGRLRELALKLTKGCGRDDGPCEIRSIFEGVRRHVRYTGDIGPILNPKTGAVEPIDYYQSPWRTWSMGGGDCDDMSALVAVLLASVGHTVRLRVSAPSKWSDWAHIYVVVGAPKLDPSKWIAVDPTLEGRAVVGSEAKYGKARDYINEYAA
jgi:hypothetical protein